MRELFPIRNEDDDKIEKCKKFLHKYCHPLQIGTGVIFSTIGIGITAAGIMYADGLNFLVQNISEIPNYVANGGNGVSPLDYMRESYKGSLSEALEVGWRQVPFSYCIGHYIGGKVRDKFGGIFGR